uniref:Uncharacterized protein n=1 Tax=Sphaerodactylus townsendi TaxID=933632 RepID=A0ACB8GC66_9SAUR
MYDHKLAKKRKDAMGNTRQEMTHMVNAMDRSYADQSTLHAEDPLSVTFMDSHNFSPRSQEKRSKHNIILKYQLTDLSIFSFNVSKTKLNHFRPGKNYWKSDGFCPCISRVLILRTIA